MRPISKFAIYVALAGTLALLFARFPKTHQETESPQPTPDQERSAAPVEPQTRLIPGPVATADHPIPTATSPSDPARPKIPAIRGVNHYGWVQLPHGTQVDFVRLNGRELWVRWDGTLAKIDSAHAANGAVVLRRPAGARAPRG